MTATPASDSPRPVARVNPMRLRFDGAGHAMAMVSSWRFHHEPFAGQRGRVGGLPEFLASHYLRMLDRGTAMAKGVRLKLSSSSSSSSSPPIADPTCYGPPHYAPMYGCAYYLSLHVCASQQSPRITLARCLDNDPDSAAYL